VETLQYKPNAKMTKTLGGKKIQKTFPKKKGKFSNRAEKTKMRGGGRGNFGRDHRSLGFREKLTRESVLQTGSEYRKGRSGLKGVGKTNNKGFRNHKKKIETKNHVRYRGKGLSPEQDGAVR